jgi:hypothetical protein
LEGNALSALEGNRYVTAGSLQNYLAMEIPRTLRTVFSKPTIQTPWFYGSQNQDFIITDLYDVLKQRSAAKPGYDQVKQVFLRLEKSTRIASLSGFIKRSHHVPDSNTSATKSFVQGISTQEIKGELERIFARIRAHMKYHACPVDTQEHQIW